MKTKIVKRYLKDETFSGFILLLAAAMALVLNNSPLAALYQNFFHQPMKFGQSFLFWINQGLMTIFFFVVGLELKREFFIGSLARGSQIVLPAFAALGGMIVPAIFYLLITLHHPQLFAGWPIPVATDIAFALGVLSLFKRVPIGLKLFLLALTIFDDIGAIIIIALYHSHHLSLVALMIACVFFGFLWYWNKIGKKKISVYLVVGLFLWIAILQAGIHGTIAGVLLASTIPLEKIPALYKKLNRWVSYCILPIFALANAGLSFSGLSVGVFTKPLVIAIISALFIGKQLGVFSFTWLLVRLKWINLPAGTTWLQVYGIAVLCGIGFTMSLFLGTLAFPESEWFLTTTRVGIFIGSILSALLGSLILIIALKRESKSRA